MGLGFPEASTFNTTPVYHTLIEQGKVDKPVFAFKIANNGSELMLGGVNHDLYQGHFYYSPLTADVRIC
jgi:Eukaryotic aspartyl protease